MAKDEMQLTSDPVGAALDDHIYFSAELFLDPQDVKFWCDRGAQQGRDSETARAL
jgi:hypothetical protein